MIANNTILSEALISTATDIAEKATRSLLQSKLGQNEEVKSQLVILGRSLLDVFGSALSNLEKK